jgi:hypothetical protein
VLATGLNSVCGTGGQGKKGSRERGPLGGPRWCSPVRPLLATCWEGGCRVRRGWLGRPPPAVGRVEAGWL